MSGEFWDYSLHTYARPGVSEVLLSLQNAHGADVNLLLLCAWHAASGRGVLSCEQFQKLDSAITPWRCAVIQPLRRLRDRIKSDHTLHGLAHADEVRAKVLEAELAGERVVQQVLESLSAAPPATTGATDTREVLRANLDAYGQYLDLPRDAVGAVDTVLQGVL